MAEPPVGDPRGLVQRLLELAEHRDPETDHELAAQTDPQGGYAVGLRRAAHEVECWFAAIRGSMGVAPNETLVVFSLDALERISATTVAGVLRERLVSAATDVAVEELRRVLDTWRARENAALADPTRSDLLRECIVELQDSVLRLATQSAIDQLADNLAASARLQLLAHFSAVKRDA